MKLCFQDTISLFLKIITEIASRTHDFQGCINVPMCVCNKMCTAKINLLKIKTKRKKN